VRGAGADGEGSPPDPEPATISARHWLADDSSEDLVDAPPLTAGSSVDRYVVLEELGTGGMGVVYAAYDPELHRKVALKLLRSSRQSEANRLLREAQAMAQLSHPNVITIYEVGTFEDQIFIAMEFVEGATMRDWLRERSRTWQEVLEMFVQGGRGLAAAHSVGLVHRDVKPGNMFVGVDGRVRMLDFGLAYAPVAGAATNAAEGSDPDDIKTHSSHDSGASDTLTGQLTETGKVMGTPAYMSPQQHVGRPTDPRSDQYSFCVALFEGLYGHRPFTGETADELKRRKWTSRIQGPSADSSVPKWVHRVVMRGLALNPEKRWADMEALLEQLGRDGGKVRRRWALGVLGVGAVAAGLFMARGEQATICAGGEERLAGVWDLDRRGAVHEALAATGVPYAAATWTNIEARLDAYTSAWVDEHRATCEVSARREQSSNMLDRRMACLDRRLDEVRALTSVLIQADAESIPKAVTAASELTPVERCADAAVLMAAAAPPTDATVAARVAAARGRLADAAALDEAGKYEVGLETVRPLVGEAEEIDYAPLKAEVAYRQGRLLDQAGEYEGSREALSRAYFTALGAGDDRLATSAAAALIVVTGAKLARAEEADTWGHHARAELERVGSDVELEASLSHALAMSTATRGDYEEALEHALAALSKLEQAYGPDDLRVARMLNNAGTAYDDLGRHEEALAHYQRALGIWEREFGTHHPNVGAALMNIGVVLEANDEPERAREHYERALEIWEASLGPEHPNVGMLLNNLAALVDDAGEPEKALAYHERAHPILRAHFRPEHPLIPMSLLNMGSVHERLGRPETALAQYEEAHRLVEGSVEADHPYRRGALDRAGNVLVELGRLDEARAKYEQLLALGTLVEGEHPDIEGRAEQQLGAIALRQGRAVEARSHLERARAIFVSAEQPERVAEVDDLLQSG
jgi:tetratricopeptide (TPR) repeat protein/predicted Ser/Thr protein kinase